MDDARMAAAPEAMKGAFAATRRKLADRVIRDRMLLSGFHLPGTAIGTLINRGTGYDFMPMSG
jgi:aspartate ammonia-lyase